MAITSRMIARVGRLLVAPALVVLLVMAASPPAQAFQTKARAAYVIDMTSGTVLLNKNGDVPLPPASMSKLMTVYIAFEALRDGRLSMDERLPVSKHAMSYGGSTMFLDTTDRVKVHDLLQGIIVLSGNDACAVIAEALSPDGTEAGFARYMTQRARELGMTQSTFKNSNGWPAPGHVMSVHDLAVLARKIITDFPEYYGIFAEKTYEFDGRAPANIHNRNPLLGLDIGADGLKTGHTEAAGFGLVGSAVQGGRRVVAVISGLDSARARAEEGEAVINWAFRQFVERQIVKSGTEVARADVWMGAAASVGLTPETDLRTVLPVGEADKVKAQVVYTGPIRAPVKKGDRLADLVIRPDGLPEMRVPLVAVQDVPRGGFTVRLTTVAHLLLDRLRKGPEGAL